MKEIDAHLALDEDRESVVCRRCDEVLCDAAENYKLSALVDRSPLTEAGPLVNDPSRYVDVDFEFRRYFCPGCATLLGTECIEANHDPVHDKELFLE